VPINLSIKNVPDEIVDRLKARANANHRSLQGEMMAILEGIAGERQGMEEPRMMFRNERPAKPAGKLTVDEIVAKVEKLGLTRRDEAASLVREDRDSR
jgi:plasmid stability protein